MRFQRILQIPLFILFLVLLWSAAYPLPSWLEVDIFLRLDPLIALGAMATDRAFVPRLVWAIVILGAALIMGRFFCGYLCPLGATIDFGDWLTRNKRKKEGHAGREPVALNRNLKYLVLFGLVGSSLAGISYVFLFSPLSIATRFYSFVIHPILLLVSNLFLDAFRPVFPAIGLERLSFLYFKVPFFDTNLFVASLVVMILATGLLKRRFWCRYICPAGALLGLFSVRPLLRRSVSDACTSCGRCLRSCPTAAIAEDFVSTSHRECITCLRCREVCPEKAVSFRMIKAGPAPLREVNLGRREVLGATVTGVATAALTMTNLHHLHGGEVPRALRSSRLIRPPGALPESEFQARCVRCGECMKGCLTNTLQPVWWEAGLSGLWSPRITGRLAGCEQNCNVCGWLCPTGAIRPLPLEEKQFAKVGTARLVKERCIAWEQDKKCLICDEICPYNAISSRLLEGRPVTVPVIDEGRCNGCGYCENKCPVLGEAAIVVEPTGELRLTSGSYSEKAKELGLVFHAKTKIGEHSIMDVQEGPRQHQEKAVSQDGKGALPPGFITE